MKTLNFFKTFFTATVLAAGCYVPPSQAIDTDLFIREPGTAGTPNILMIFDNSSAWNANDPNLSATRQTIMHEAMFLIYTELLSDVGRYQLWDSTKTDAQNNLEGRIKVNLGLLGYSGITTKNGSKNNASGSEDPRGGKPYQHIQLLDRARALELRNELYFDSGTKTYLDFNDVDTDSSGDISAAEFAAVAGKATIIENSGNSAVPNLFMESYQYFSGGAPFAGIQDIGTTTYRDNDGTIAGDVFNNLVDEEAFFATPATATTADVPDAIYRNDFLTDNSCGGNHIMAFLYRIPANESSEARCHTGDGDGLDQNCAAGTTTSKSPEDTLVDVFGYDLISEVGPQKYIDINGDGSVTSTYKEAQMPDEYAKWLFEGIDLDGAGDDDPTITTHVINLNSAPGNPSSQREEDYQKSIASSGGGEYTLASDAQSVVEAFFDTLNSILATNAVFASTALPVSVNVRGTNLNQIYLGVFRADDSNRARWWGNLKQYKLGLNAGNIELQDADGNTAQGADGFIDKDARSLWSHTTAHRTADADGNTGYWSYDLRGNVSDEALQDEDNPDGEVVEKGAAAQYLRELVDGFAPFDAAPHPATRRIFTCVGCASGTALGATTATDFSTSNANLTDANLGITAAQTDAALDPEYDAARIATITAANLIGFVRGIDNATPYNLGNNVYSDEDLDASSTDARPQIHGDVLHSRPSIVNYNRLGDDSDVIVFYGANEGMIHALQGGDEDHPNDGDASDTGTDPNNSPNELLPAGSEIWSFVAEEHFGKLFQHFENDAVDGFANPRSTENREIFFDGTFTTLTRDKFNEAVYELFVGAGFGSGVAASVARIALPAQTYGTGQRLIKYDGVADRVSGDDDDEVLLFVAARRGGDLLYAFDISDPYNPEFKWRKRGPDAGDGLVDGLTGTADAGFEELGQTWSAPLPISLELDVDGDGDYDFADQDVNGDSVFDYQDVALGGGPTDVLVFGKGFNPANDDVQPDAATPLRPTNAAGAQSTGAGIMILNADTGEPIWQTGQWSAYPVSSPGEYLEVSGMTWSIPSDVTPVDRDRNGIFEKFYVGDTGGNVWRGDIRDPDPANWTVTQLADLADHSDNLAKCDSGAIVADQSLCTNQTCDISGTPVTNPTDCPTYICADGTLTMDPAGGDCPAGGGFTCDNSGDSVSDPALCPDYECLDSTNSQGGFVSDPDSCQVVCLDGGSNYLRNAPTNPNHALNRNCDGSGKNKDAARLQDMITQESATAVGGGGPPTQETASPEDAELYNGDDDRRFLFAPDVVPNGDPAFDAVLVGSGDRELPDSAFVEDRFYMLKDFWVEGATLEATIDANLNIGDGGSRLSDGIISSEEQGESEFTDQYPYSDTPTDAASTAGLDAGTELYNATNNTLQTGSDADQLLAQDGLDDEDNRGWFINLIGPTATNSADDDDSTTQLGEKVVSSAVTLGGTVFFNTNEPTSGVSSCDASLGTARAYQVGFLDGTVPDSNLSSGDLTERFDVLASGGFPPSPVPFVVEIDGDIYSGVQIGPIPVPAPTEVYNQRQRVFWFQDVDISN